MKQKRLLLLLALLITAATGAWGKQIYISYPAWPSGMSVNGDGNLVLEVELSDSFENLKSKIEDKTEGRLDMQYMHLFYEGTECPNNETLYAKGVAANSVLTLVYGKYTVALADGTADAGNWTATLGSSTTPQSLPVYTNRGDAVTLTYGGHLKVKSVTATHDGWNGDLSNIPASALDGNTLIVPNGATLKGELDVSTIPYKVVIPDGATVTLAGVTIEGENNDAYTWAGITCEGHATIILADNSENTVKGFYEKYPGIYVPMGKKLTIKGGKEGNGKLTASSNGNAAGIGGGWFSASCGHIEIQGGDITATGGWSSAGIGSGPGARCGLITIIGGTVTATGGEGGAGIGSGNQPGANCGIITIIGGTVKATGGDNGAGIGSGSGGGVNCDAISIEGGTVTATGDGYAAGIGSGFESACGDIFITDDVTMTSVTAAKGTDAPYSIGAGGDCDGQSSSCGTVTIGGTVYWDNNAAVDEAAATYLAQATIVYPNPFALVTPGDIGKMIGLDGKVYDTADDASDAGTTAVAIIAYVGDEPGNVDASSPTYKGLALALDEGGLGGAIWGDYSGTCLPGYSAGVTDMNGIVNTNTLVSHPSEHFHVAAIWARNHNMGTHPAGTSEWFLPSAGQWNKMGSTFNFETDTIGGYTPMSSGSKYWSSTEIDASNAYCFDHSIPGLDSHSKSDSNVKVRACIAF